MKITRILKGAGIRSSYGTMGSASVTLVEDRKRILVDTGHFGNRDVLLSRLKSLDIQTSEIAIIVLTHLNWDHCLNVDLFEDAEIVLGKAEFDSGTLSGLSDGISENFKEYLSERKLKLVEDGYVVAENITVISTPGHTPGHIALKVQDNRNLIVFSGDCIPNLRAYRRGVPDIIFYDLDQAKESIARIKELNPDVVYPGHDPPFSDKGYIEFDPVDVYLRNEDETNTVMTLNRTSADEPVIHK